MRDDATPEHDGDTTSVTVPIAVPWTAEDSKDDILAFQETYIQGYKAVQAERNRRLYDKRLAAEGRSRQPILTEADREERRKAAKERAKERAMEWQRANREAYNARRAEIRREKRAGTFVDRRKKVAYVYRQFMIVS